jgi:hypothetical protein
MRQVFSKTVSDEQGRISIADGTFQEIDVEEGWADLVVIAQVPWPLSSTHQAFNASRPSTGAQTMAVPRRSLDAS